MTHEHDHEHCGCGCDHEAEGNAILELTDENGEVTEFEHLLTVEHEGELYIILMPLYAEEKEDDDEEGEEVIILKIEKDEETGEDTYVSVDSEETCEKVFELFMQALEEEEE